MPFCVFSAVTCSALQAPPNGIRQGCTGTTTEYYSTVCLFSCNAGFIATGSPSRKCLRNGTWSGQEFLCQGEINYYSSPYRRLCTRGNISCNPLESSIQLAVESNQAVDHFIVVRLEISGLSETEPLPFNKNEAGGDLYDTYFPASAL